ncbi:hypothetical protein EON73_00495 [bacterium]|nr:MAG: hypothetical protein EON73_00495 [bacterium]
MSFCFVLLTSVSVVLYFLRCSPLIGCLNILFLSLLSAVNLYEIVLSQTVKYYSLYSGFLVILSPFKKETIDLGVYLDLYSSHMIWLVYSISFLVHFYSLSYMKEDPRISLFILYLSLFTGGMVVLLVSPNYVQLFIGWELVGLTSYKLVNFWYTRTAANKAALKALIVNRVGDYFFLFFLFLLVP